MLCLYFWKSWLWNAFGKQKQLNKQRPSLCSRLTSNECLSYEDYIWMKIAQKAHFGKDLTFLKCVLYTHKSVHEENFLRMYEAFQYYWYLVIKGGQLPTHETTRVNFTDIVTTGKMDPEEYVLYESTYMKSREIKTNFWWVNSESACFWGRIWLERGTGEFSGVMTMFSILFWVVVTWLHSPSQLSKLVKLNT